MILTVKAEEARACIREEQLKGAKIGVVPTMGALHLGHQALVEHLSKQCDYVCMWIFVNPTQFNDPADYERYPRSLRDDAEIARLAGVDLLFSPSENTMYPEGLKAYAAQQSPRVHSGSRAAGHEGARRPGHFNGVAHICSCFFNILQPDVVVFGEKDYQQLKVIEQLVADLQYQIEITSVPIVREESGLAFSSRNALLEQAEKASILYRTMCDVKDRIQTGETDTSALCDFGRERIESVGYAIDYFEIVDSDSLEPISEARENAHLLLAVYADNNVRLIDNLRLT